jgi:uncharacterized protein YdeI (BOF family)
MREKWLIAVAALLAAGCGGPPKILGQAPKGKLVPIAAVRTLAASSPALIRGKMVEKCPAAGCWFVVRDKTGLVKVDTKSAGFVVLDVPLGTEMTVVGTAAGSGDGRLIEATGVRY